MEELSALDLIPNLRKLNFRGRRITSSGEDVIYSTFFVKMNANPRKTLCLLFLEIGSSYSCEDPVSWAEFLGRMAAFHVLGFGSGDQNPIQCGPFSPGAYS